jgi:hypothetical protein
MSLPDPAASGADDYRSRDGESPNIWQYAHCVPDRAGKVNGQADGLIELPLLEPLVEVACVADVVVEYGCVDVPAAH